MGNEIIDNVTEGIGNTNVVRVKTLTGPDDAELFGKLEYGNPGGSVKDRPALFMILAAERLGLLHPGKNEYIVEATSGNTGIGLAMVARVRGYKTVFTMPENVSDERKYLLSRVFHSELILTSKDDGMEGAMRRAEQIERDRGIFYTKQFENPANVEAHELTTGPEIIKAFPDGLDYFVSGVGTGGTITGVGRALRRAFPNIEIIAVEPDASPVLSGGKKGLHKITGIGAGFIPPILDQKIYNRIIQVSFEEAQRTAQALSLEGICVGTSSAAITYAALQVAGGQKGLKVLAILPDHAERYGSTTLYGDK